MTKTKKTLIACGALSAVAVVGIGSSVLLMNKTLNRTTADDNYWIIFNSNTNVLNKSTTYESGSTTAKTQRSSEIVFDYSNMSHANNSWQTIAKDGYFMNTTKVNGMNSLNITFANDGASIELQYGWNSLEPTSAVTLDATNKQISYTFPLVEEKYPSLIKITAVNSDQTITAMGIEFTCSASDVMTKTEFSEVYSFTETDDAIIITGYKGTATDVIIPSQVFGNKFKSITSIGVGAFQNCTSLETLTIGSGVTTIDFFAFYGCTSLKSVVIPNTVISIGTSAFVVCPSLSSIVVDPNNTTYDSRNDCNAIIKKSTNELIVGCKNTVIPNTVISIGDSAFSDCTALASIVIPEGITKIGDDAFNGCTSLETVTIGSGVTSIELCAFQNCTSLNSISYSGTQIQWYSVAKKIGWHEGCPATVVHCSDGDVAI